MSKLLAWVLVLAVLVAGCTTPAVTPGAGLTSSTTSSSSVPTKTTLVIPVQTPAPSLTPVPTSTATVTATPILDDDIIAYEMRAAFNFFWEQANTDPKSPGYGLIRDRYPGSDGIASTASVGFGLTAYLVGIDQGYISYQDGYDRVNSTLDTLLSLERTEGFFYHYLDMKTGKRAWDSEVSSIDTAILMMGVVTAGQYFSGEIGSKADMLYQAVNWPWFIDQTNNMFYMAYRQEKGFEGHWDFYAEQLMLYVLAAGSETHPVDETPYYTFTRHTASYRYGKPFIHAWFGSLFTYQYSQAWINFKNYTDQDGVNWFDNSVAASLAQYQFASDVQGQYKTLSPKAWGLTACDGPNGYNGTYGAPPSGFDNKSHFIDDTVAPSAAIGSIIFVPEQSLQAMRNYYSIEPLKGKYGFVDAYNLAKNWFDSDVIGIDKGISLLMLANYQGNVVHKIVMDNPNILHGLEVLNIKPGSNNTP